MKRSRPVVQWSPHGTNEFVVAFSTDIKLLESVSEVGESGDPFPDFADVAEDSGRTKLRNNLIMVRSMKRAVRCIDWFPGPSDRKLLASGDISGAVQVVSLQDNKHLDASGVVQSFVPTYGRQCNAVAWNPKAPNLLCCGLDKLRNDNSILVWDVSQSMPELNSSIPDQYAQWAHWNEGQAAVKAAPQVQQYSRYPQVAGVKKTFFETGMSEGTVALAWVPEQPMCIAAGTSFKWLRIYDVRSQANTGSSALAVVAHSKSVRGVTFDPTRSECFATFSEEGQIKVWDIRKLDSAVVAIACNSKNITEIAWSPVRSGILAAVTLDERCITLWDVKNKSSDWFALDETQGQQHRSDTGSLGGGGAVVGIETSSSTSVNESPNLSPGVLDTASSQRATTGGVSAEASGIEHGEERGQRNTVVLTKCDVRRYTSRTPASFCWIPSNTSLWSNKNHFLPPSSSDHARAMMIGPSTNRVLYASWSGILDDVSLQDPLPLAVSAGSDLCFGLNSNLFRFSFLDLDPSAVARVRTKLGYSMDALKNVSLISGTIEVATFLQQFSENKKTTDLEQLVEKFSPDSVLEMVNMVDLSDLHSEVPNLVRMRDMWRWVYRASHLLAPQQSKGLVDAGLITVLSRRSTSQDEVRLDDKLRPGFEVYRSRQRTFALAMCGWFDFDDIPDTGHGATVGLGAQAPSEGETNTTLAGSNDADSTESSPENSTFLHVKKQEMLFSGGMTVTDSFAKMVVKTSTLGPSGSASSDDSDYQRLAALAVFYCDLKSAVRILQEAAERIRKQKREAIASSRLQTHPNAPSKQNQKRLLKKIATRLGAVKATQATQHTRRDSRFPRYGRQARNLDDDGLADLLQLVAMAMAGYPDSSTPTHGGLLWHDMCRKLLKRLQRLPILRAALFFLVKNFLRRQSHGKSQNQNASSTTSATVSPSGSGEDATKVGRGGEHEKEGKGDGSAAVSGSGVGSSGVSGPSSQQPSVSGTISGLKDLGPNTASASIDRLTGKPETEDSELELEADAHAVGDVDYSCVTDETAIALVDRVAFACRFLPNDQLFSFLLRCCEHSTVQGHLDGLLLTGLGEHGLRLIQNYVDRTGDIQTAAVVSCHAVPEALSDLEASRVNRWVVSYRDLLNNWQLWQERARFDVTYASLQRARRKASPQTTTPSRTTSSSITEQSEDASVRQYQELLSWSAREPQLYVVCTHCKESLLLSTLLGDSTILGSIGRINRRKLTLPCCPRCKKRLSSCAVCVLPMNCINPYAQMAGLSQRDRSRISRVIHPENDSKHDHDGPTSTAQPFGRWFSWCLRCRHGGHAVCLMEWFSSHSRCPVSDCNCPCTILK